MSKRKRSRSASPDTEPVEKKAKFEEQDETTDTTEDVKKDDIKYQWAGIYACFEPGHPDQLKFPLDATNVAVSFGHHDDELGSRAMHKLDYIGFFPRSDKRLLHPVSKDVWAGSFERTYIFAKRMRMTPADLNVRTNEQDEFSAKPNGHGFSMLTWWYQEDDSNYPPWWDDSIRAFGVNPVKLPFIRDDGHPVAFKWWPNARKRQRPEPKQHWIVPSNNIVLSMLSPQDRARLCAVDRGWRGAVYSWTFSRPLLITRLLESSRNYTNETWLLRDEHFWGSQSEYGPWKAKNMVVFLPERLHMNNVVAMDVIHNTRHGTSFTAKMKCVGIRPTRSQPLLMKQDLSSSVMNITPMSKSEGQPLSRDYEVKQELEIEMDGYPGPFARVKPAAAIPRGIDYTRIEQNINKHPHASIWRVESVTTQDYVPPPPIPRNIYTLGDHTPESSVTIRTYGRGTFVDMTNGKDRWDSYGLYTSKLTSTDYRYPMYWTFIAHPADEIHKPVVMNKSEPLKEGLRWCFAINHSISQFPTNGPLVFVEPEHVQLPESEKEDEGDD